MLGISIDGYKDSWVPSRPPFITFIIVSIHFLYIINFHLNIRCSNSLLLGLIALNNVTLKLSFTYIMNNPQGILDWVRVATKNSQIGRSTLLLALLVWLNGTGPKNNWSMLWVKEHGPHLLGKH